MQALKNKKLIAATLLAASQLSLLAPSAFANNDNVYGKANYTLNAATKEAAASVYQYHPNSVYHVDTQKNFLTDIELHPGEKITFIGGGNTSQWMVTTSTVNGVPHVYIKPIDYGIMTNLIVNTNGRSYHFAVYSTNKYNHIKFEYPDEIRKAMMREQARPVYKNKAEEEWLTTHTQIINGISQAKNLDYNYTMKSHGVAKENMPSEFFSDGTRTYIKIPAGNKYDFPTLYLVNDKGKLTLINYTVYGQYLVAERVFTRARLQYTTNSYIDVVPKKVKEVK